MKAVKVSEATNTQLDWLVAKRENHQWRCHWMLGKDGYAAWQSYEQAWGNPTPNYTTDPAQMWPIIEREKIATNWRITNAEGGGYWQAENLFTDTYGFIGPTSLIAAARCYVASKLGDVVEVPKELT